MTAVIPARFLFRWSWPVKRCDAIPHNSGRLLNLDELYRCYSLAELDRGPDFAELRLAWNPRGFALSAEVHGKQQALNCSPLAPTASDGVLLWLDTRSTQTVHRATRYCHQFSILPAGSGKTKGQPSVTNLSLVRGESNETAVTKGTGSPIRVWSDLRDDGYLLEAWFPAESLIGYDPDNHRQMGFYVVVRDAELGEQYLTVGREFPFDYDPSLWQTLELVDG
jgi:hypothetical protein